MIAFYKTLSQLLKLILNIVFFIQIALMILIFLTAAYWFFDLINSSLFAFAAPLANAIATYVKSLYTHDIMLDGIYIDGSLLLFDIVAAVAVVVISKLKYYFYKFTERLDYMIILATRKNEKKFNDELQKEAEEIIKRYRKAAILIEFNAKNIEVDDVWGGDPNAGVKEKSEEALKIFYATLKTVSGCSFAVNNNRLAVMVDDFDKLDNVLVFAEQTLKRIRDNMKKRNWELVVYIAADVFYDSTDFRNEVYPNMEKLLALKHKDKIICYGNFNLRYNLMHEPMYYFILNSGDYVMSNTNETLNIFTLVKKD